MFRGQAGEYLDTQADIHMVVVLLRVLGESLGFRVAF